MDHKHSISDGRRPDQTIRMHRLIRVYADRICHKVDFCFESRIYLKIPFSLNEVHIILLLILSFMLQANQIETFIRFAFFRSKIDIMNTLLVRK